MNASDPTASPTSWAILIGIDEYSTDKPGHNLNGCVNDVSSIYAYLLKEEWSKANIAVLIAPRQHVKGSTPFLRDTSYDKPTRKKVFDAIDRIYKKAKAGDTVLIHYSGHGGYRKTRYPKLKGTGARDELICLLGGDMSDVTLGRELDNLAARFAVVITLDCCHSGGATRGDKPTDNSVRCWPSDELRIWDDIAGDIVEESTASSDEESEQFGGLFDEVINEDVTVDTQCVRNVSLQPSGLYRSRNYTVLSACQAHEVARESTFSGLRQGVWTEAYISTLTALGERSKTESYGELHKQLSLRIRDDGFPQRPLHFGLANRQIFGANLRDVVDPHRAYVSRIESNARMATIDKGVLAGVQRGDTYQLLSAGNITHGHKRLTISAVEEFSAKGKFISMAPAGSPSDSINPRVGWVAELESRSGYATVRIVHDEAKTMGSGDNNTLKTFRATWRQYDEATEPLVLEFDDANPAQGGVDILVRLGNGVFTFHDFRGILLERFPKLPTDVPDVSMRLMNLLRHLQRFNTVFRLQSPVVRGSTKPYQWSFEQYTDTTEEAPADVISRWRLKVTNLPSSRHDLYCTCLTLTPLYGVRKILPLEEDDRVGRIVPGETWEEPIDIDMINEHSEWFREPGTNMRDIFKVCISKELPSRDAFKGLELEELTTAIPSELRARSGRQQVHSQSWWIETMEVLTPLPWCSSKGES